MSMFRNLAPLALAWALVMAFPACVMAQDADDAEEVAEEVIEEDVDSQPDDGVTVEDADAKATEIKAGEQSVAKDVPSDDEKSFKGEGGVLGYAEFTEKAAAGIKRLIDEANVIDKYREGMEASNEQPPVVALWKKVHPQISHWGPEMCPMTVKRMVRDFTGNEYRDTYIRWHLVSVLEEKAKQSDLRKMGPDLVKLVNNMPGPIKVPLKPTHKDVPPEIARRYHQLMGQTYVWQTSGYPPFVKRSRIGPPKSFDLMPASRRAKAKKAYEEALALRGQWKRIHDREASRFNARIRKMNWVIRQYRGELIYLVLRTGDPKMLKVVTNAIEKHARQQNGIAFDLMAFMYRAAFDGVLEMYDGEDLAKVSKELERVARGKEEYLKWGGRERNFADYAFHMVHILREIEGVSGKISDDMRLDPAMAEDEGF